MSRIEPTLDLMRLRGLWERVFRSKDPFGSPFQEPFDEVAVFFPTEGYHLSQAQYRAVSGAAREVGDTGFFVSVIEYDGDFWQRGEHWWCQFPPYEDYLRLPLVLENALYSSNGQWGLLVSHEDHAVVSGTQAFMNKLRDLYPRTLADAVALRASWAGKPNSGWIENLLANQEK